MGTWLQKEGGNFNLHPLFSNCTRIIDYSLLPPRLRPAELELLRLPEEELPLRCIEEEPRDDPTLLLVLEEDPILLLLREGTVLLT